MHQQDAWQGNAARVPERRASLVTWQNMWQGGSAMSLSAAGFQAVSTSRRSFGLVLILWMSSASCRQYGLEGGQHVLVLCLQAWT